MTFLLVTLVVVFVGVVLAKMFLQNSLDPIFQVTQDDPEMCAAMEKARAEIDQFVSVMRAGTGATFSVKVPIQENGFTEHFWVNELSYHNGEFIGQIDNDPEVVTSVRAGQRVAVKKNEISDWLYLTEEGLMKGNYTLRVMLDRMPRNQAEHMRQELQLA